MIGFGYQGILSSSFLNIIWWCENVIMYHIYICKNWFVEKLFEVTHASLIKEKFVVNLDTRGFIGKIILTLEDLMNLENSWSLKLMCKFDLA